MTVTRSDGRRFSVVSDREPAVPGGQPADRSRRKAASGGMHPVVLLATGYAALPLAVATGLESLARGTPRGLQSCPYAIVGTRRP